LNPSIKTKGKSSVPAPLCIPGRQRTASRAQDTQRSNQGQDTTGYADWGFAPMTGFAPKKDDASAGAEVLLPSQGGSWGFAEESVVTTPTATPEPVLAEALAGTPGSKKPRKKKSAGEALQGGDENVPRSSQAKEGTPTPGSRTPSMAIDCSPHGIEELRSRAGERPKSRQPSRGVATDLGECRPPTKHREKTPSSSMMQRRKEESRRMSRGSNMTASRQQSRGGVGVGGQREPSRGFGGFTRGFGGQRAGVRRGSVHGEGMTIKCDTYSRTGQMGGTMSYT